MNKKKLVNALILIVGLLASLACLQTGYADTFIEAATSIPIQQQFESNEKNKAGIFTYQLEAVNEESPMPTNQSVYEFTIRESETHMISLTFDQPGVYHYEVKQVIPDKKKQGYTYDTRKLFIEVYVSYARNQQLLSNLIVKNETGLKVESLTFENSFFNSKIAGHQENKKYLPKTGEEATFLFSITGIGCIWLICLCLIYKHKSTNQNEKKS